MDLVTTLIIWSGVTAGAISVKLIRDRNVKKVQIQNCRKYLKRFKSYNTSLNEPSRRG